MSGQYTWYIVERVRVSNPFPLVRSPTIIFRCSVVYNIIRTVGTAWTLHIKCECSRHIVQYEETVEEPSVH